MVNYNRKLDASKKTLYMREYRIRNRDRIEARRRELYALNGNIERQKNQDRYYADHERSKAKRRNHYAKQRSVWNSLGFSHNHPLWNKAEELAVDILKDLGYENIDHIGGHGVFDILASKDGKEYVFDVTMKVHTYKKLGCEMVKRWGLNYRVIFITLQHQKYVIKEFKDKGYARLTRKDMENACLYKTSSHV